MKAFIFLFGCACGVIAREAIVWKSPMTDCVIIKGEKGRATPDGRGRSGDAGDGIICRNGFVITPGQVAK